MKHSSRTTTNVCFFILSILVSCTSFSATNEVAETVYKNGFVYTVDGFHSISEAFAVKDGKFIAVGTNKEMKNLIGKGTKTVDLKGEMVMPGLVDTHIHALRGALTSLGLAFPATSSIEDIQKKLAAFIKDKKLKKGEWVEGAKWSQDYKTLNAEAC